ncbi:hypothetical protein COCC4DRAFT_125945 [Bipolaris maydis ATCC 48331]|uniref:Uncharacterized protein n=1 Tax=Cochliobolus heterostrophus (strain C4 / ATCC 48331 / race T) TaxID=665024 RepID=N4XXB8_COCH4|nr:uncharacterized protein COCC4DRAFT_125945 [Bipolaris maydis ATCC 48331]ENI09842.1 hypothetical protein COCC4DRAFT_125945 [Bipolaris maydis ATCC 48331]
MYICIHRLLVPQHTTRLLCVTRHSRTHHHPRRQQRMRILPTIHMYTHTHTHPCHACASAFTALPPGPSWAHIRNLALVPWYDPFVIAEFPSRDYYLHCSLPSCDCVSPGEPTIMAPTKDVFSPTRIPTTPSHVPLPGSPLTKFYDSLRGTTPRLFPPLRPNLKPRCRIR